MSALHYSKAPIIEALVDFRIERAPQTILGALQSIELPAGYKEFGVVAEFTGELRIEQLSPVTSAQGGAIGYRFQSADGKYVMQARLDGFTFSRLAPYDRWEPFIAEAQTLWNRYRAIVSKAAVVQFSVRYVNKLHMPPGSEMSKYLRTFPQVSDELPQLLQGSFMRLEMPLNDPAGILILQQYYAPAEQPDQIAMILDNELRFPVVVTPLSDTMLWTQVEKVRELKNRFFRGCLTPLMEKMIA